MTYKMYYVNCACWQLWRTLANLRNSVLTCWLTEAPELYWQPAEPSQWQLESPAAVALRTRSQDRTDYILHPTSGEAEVMGHIPWRERQKLAFKIGTVFGQRPQLWYHLPAIDTFTLFGKIFEMDDRETKMRIGQLAEAFEIGDLLETPVRKLSLGQRMRCEVAASLLHHPRLLLLDEPSIGLDVVAKQNIREMIKAGMDPRRAVAAAFDLAGGIAAAYR